MRPTILPSSVLLGALALGRPLSAQQATLPDTADVCAAPRTQLDLNDCAADRYRTAERALNRTYQALLRATPPEGRSSLQTAQRAWLRYRDAECTYAASRYEGGSMQPMQRAQCLTALTTARTRQLRQHLEGGTR